MADVLVLGRHGMLGQTVFRRLESRGWRVAGTQFVDPAEEWYLDAAADPSSWRPVFEAAACRFVINCIGILKADIRDADCPSLQAAIRVNALFPHLAAATGVRIIHMSTDGVFAGGRAEPYLETDAPDCRDHYGRTKALGECTAPNVLNIRCSIAGRDENGKGILEWLLRQKEAPGYTDQLWNGVTTSQFADLCATLLSERAFDSARETSAVHHFCPNPPTTKYDLLCAWRDVAKIPVEIRPVASNNPSAIRLLGTRYASLPSLYAPRTDWREILSELTTSPQ